MKAAGGFAAPRQAASGGQFFPSQSNTRSRLE
jgi:hypothetical protein